MSGDERVSVQTYVTASQRDRWQEEADERDMSQAEYVRSMVQAGRRSFSLNTDADSLNTESSNPVEAGSGDVTPGGEGMKDRILEILQAEGSADWDELVASVTDDVEQRLEEALEELQAADRIRYSGRAGGYTEVDDGR